jgi:hypothetical protein
MLIWVFLVVALIIIVSIWRFFFDGWNDGVVGPFFMWLLASVVSVAGLALVYAGLAHLSAHELKATNEYRDELRALDSDSAIEGHSYFLGGGYVGEERVLNYIIRNPDGSSQLGHTKASKAKIWEDEQEKPYVVQIEKEYGNWWFAFDEGYRNTYEYHYHIPANSVLESTKITNK